jgi:DeoR/GlpR family transcriptional regulator of sugar metabolism
MMKAADEVVIVADSTKFGRTSLSRLCELSRADILVVDNEITQEWQEKLNRAGVKLIIADAKDRAQN